MRKFIDGQNVDPASGDYPKGRARNKTISVGGTIWSEEILGDILQFFQKIVIDGGIVENDLPDNVSNGYQLLDALLLLSGGLKRKIVNIGIWNINSSGSGEENVIVSHGITDFLKIRNVTAVIKNDDENSTFPINSYGITGSSIQGAISRITTTDVTIRGFTGGYFDSLDFDSEVIDRGWIIIDYLP